MLETLQLHHYPSDVLYFVAIGAFIAGAISGYATHAVMGDRGFGVAGDGILVMFGAMVGIYVRNAYLGMMQPGDLAFTGLFAAASATILILLLGLAKKWVQG